MARGGEKQQPSVQSFHRKGGGGYRRCPHCMEIHQVGGAPVVQRERACYGRFLLDPESKQWILDVSRARGLSMSAFVRMVLLDWRMRQEASPDG